MLFFCCCFLYLTSSQLERSFQGQYWHNSSNHKEKSDSLFTSHITSYLKKAGGKWRLGKKMKIFHNWYKRIKFATEFKSLINSKDYLRTNKHCHKHKHKIFHNRVGRLYFLKNKRKTNNTCTLMSTVFSSIQGGMYPLRKAYNYKLHPISPKFPQCCFWNSSNTGLIHSGPFWSFQGRS